MPRGHVERFTLLTYPTISQVAGPTIDVAGLQALAIQAQSSSPSLTVTWQGSVDGTSWGSVLGIPGATGTAAATAANPADDAVFVVDVSGLTNFRANVTAYTSGSVGLTAAGMY